MEALVFGRQLQAARTAFVRQLVAPRRALLVGDGDGRFLEELRRAQPEVQIECLDASARMLELARERVGDNCVQYLQADIRAAGFPPRRYDLIVTHFFLDCFAEETLQQVVEKLSATATDDASWLIADFCEPAQGWRRRWGRFLIAAMYHFFRIAAGVEARRLVPYASLLQIRGFRLTNEKVSPNEMIRSQVWQRQVGPARSD